MKRLRIVLAVLLSLSVAPLAGCSSARTAEGSSGSNQSAAASGSTAISSSRLSNGTSSSKSSATRSDSTSSRSQSRGIATRYKEYEDERWPTTNSQLLAIPESQRWYNASSRVGTWCTIAGPVVRVTYSGDSAGKPVFVNIGAAYPSTSSVQLVVWTEGDWSAFSPMLTDVDQNEHCWLSVTGYLQSYNGYMQFDSSDGCEFRWWTNVS